MISRIFPALHEDILSFTDGSGGPGSGNYMLLENGCLEMVLHADRGSAMGEKLEDMADLIRGFLLDGMGAEQGHGKRKV